MPAAFWRMTPREFWRTVGGLRRARRDQERLELGHAYLNAVWQRAEKMPKWETVVKGVDAKPGVAAPMSPAESRQRVRAALGGFGVTVKTMGAA